MGKAVEKCSNVWWPKTTNERRTTNDELIGPNFRDLIGTNSDRLVRIPIDWSEFRTIGPNSERMTNDEFDVANDVNAFDVVKFVKVLNARKKSAWTDLDRVDFENFFFKESMFKSKNRRGQV